MNYVWRIVGLIVVAIPIAWLALRSFTPQQQSLEVPASPVRELFHASKPIQVSVIAIDDVQRANERAESAGQLAGGERPKRHQDGAATASAMDSMHIGSASAWLEYELRQLLSRARMRVAPVTPAATAEHYTLRIELAKTVTSLVLIGPDGIIERRAAAANEDGGKLAMLSAIVARLPEFLDAGHAQHDWVRLIGTDDPQAFESYENTAFPILGPDGPGLTRPLQQRYDHKIALLETLVRKHPDFARAWAALSAVYLSQGGVDEPSLRQLARSSAERALALDGRIADAHAILGLVHLRKGEWLAARERFDQALALDVNNAPALEGLACLLVDAGYYSDALPIALRSLALQAHNSGSQECLAYANLQATKAAAKAGDFDTENQTGQPLNLAGEAASGPGVSRQAADPASLAATSAKRSSSDNGTVPTSLPALQVRALASILANDLPLAKDLLRNGLNRRDFNEWAAPLLKAAENPRQVPGALQAITRAANEQRIDATTEILCGAALHQAEFVFNRIARLQLQSAHIPLRILWMPETAFLRQSRHFEKIIAASGIGAYWQEYGPPDICIVETTHSLCQPGAAPAMRNRS